MEKQSKLPPAKRSSSKNIGKLFTQRKTVPIKDKNPDTLKNLNEKGELAIFYRENPMIYLQSLKEDHKKTQRNLQQSFLSSNKWRSYNSPALSPRMDQNQKQNIFLQSIYTKRKQLQAIKVYNHIHNKSQSNNFQQPEFVTFIQEAIARSTKKGNLLSATTTPHSSNAKRLSKIKKNIDIKQNYTIGDQRKQLQNLQVWIKTKLQTFETNETQGESMFVDRINFLNMAFGQVSRIAGTFSSQTKNTIQYLHKKYYQYYNFLTQCMIEQNKRIKAEISSVEERLLRTINYYEDKMQKVKSQNEEKSEKIITNFQKCIQVKKKLQKENKEVKRSFNNQKKKSKIVEQALIKVITLFLALGQKNIHEMTFTLDQSQANSYVKSSMLAKSKKHIMTEQERQIQRRKQIFQEWCGYLIKMIHRILIKDICYREGIDVQTALFKNQAFDIIKHYMVENDDTLSLADAERILNNFLSSQQEEHKLRLSVQNGDKNNKEIKEKQLKELQLINRKFEDMYNDVSYQLPTFEQVYNKLSINDMQVQVEIKNETENGAVQTFIQTTDTGSMAIQKTKSREVDASYHYKEKATLQSCVFMYTQVFKRKEPKKIYKLDERLKTHIRQSFQLNEEMAEEVRQNQKETSRFSETSRTSNSKKKTRQSKNHPQNMIDIILCSESKKQIGINTIITKIKNKMRTVQFSIPHDNEDDPQLQRNTFASDGNQNDNGSKTGQEASSSKHHSVKSIDSKSDIKSNDESVRSIFSKRRRKNGFMITGDRKKTQLSQRFIPNQSETSILSDESIDSDKIVEKEVQETTSLQRKKQDSLFKHPQLNLVKRQTSLCSQNSSSQNNRVSLQKQGNFDKIFSKNQKKYQTFEQKLSLNRSFFNLARVQYASQQDADVHRIKDYVIRVPKKKTIRQRCLIDPLDFHLELAFKNHEKIKFLSSVNLWHPKLMFEMRKIRHRVNNIKPYQQINSKIMNLTKGYFTHVLNPIIKDLIKSYCQEMKTDRFDFGDSMLTSSFKGMKNLALKKQLSQSSNGFDKSQTLQTLSYYQRLSPLLYNVINFTQYNQNKTSTDNQMFFSGLKTMRNQNSKMEVYNLLIEGSCVEIDIFVKTIFQFNITITSNMNYQPELSYFILETALNQALEEYLNANQIKKIIEETKNYIILGLQSNPVLHRRTSFKNDFRRDSTRNHSTKKLSQHSKISYFELLKVIFRHIKAKQQVQRKKYSIISEIICRNSQCVYYEDIMHFLQCLPIQNEKRKKILSQCLKKIVYWNKVQPTVPSDILFFILDKYQLYSNHGHVQNTTLIKEYIINRCELYFKGTLQKVTKNPEWVLNSTYILSYKIPKLFHRILYQIKTGKNLKQKKLLLSLLTQIFCNLIDIEMDKRYMPSLLNGLTSIPLF